MSALDDLELQMMDLEERLRPIAQRPVDITRPGWLERLQTGRPPLDEAGVRDAAERLLSALIVAYAQGEETREAVRRLFTEYRSFAWAAALPGSADEPCGLAPALDCLLHEGSRPRQSRCAFDPPGDLPRCRGRPSGPGACAAGRSRHVEPRRQVRHGVHERHVVEAVPGALAGSWGRSVRAWEIMSRGWGATRGATAAGAC